MSILKLTLHLLLLILSILIVSGDYFFQEPHHCHNFENFSYLVIEKSFNWDETKQYCKTFGGALPTPRDKNQMDFLSKKIDWKQYNVKRYWIGLTNRGMATRWNWIGDSPLTFSNWNKKGLKFDQMGVADCAFVNVRLQHTWGDMTCNEKKDITTVCNLEDHAWSPWSKWSECDCNHYLQQRTRICGTSSKARVTCPCRGSNVEKKLCSCLSRWKKFKKDYSDLKNLTVFKSVPTENLVVCAMYCLQERVCSGFSFSGQNMCNFYIRSFTSSSLPTDTTETYMKVDEGQQIITL